jgi:hypothetical protein
LTLVKKVNNDNGGGAVTTDFTLKAAGTTLLNALSGDGGVSSEVNADTYTLSETTTVTGYTPGAWSCLGTGTFTLPDTIKLEPGQTAKCEITNFSKKATLTLVKKVDNDNGGKATKGDFTLSASVGSTAVVSGPGGATGSVKADTYTLSETSLVGYTAGDWSCDHGLLVGNSLTLGPGQSAECTIINTYEKPIMTSAMSWVLHDSVTITGLRSGDEANATVTFKLFGPNDATCTTVINGNGSGEPVGVGTVVENGVTKWVTSTQAGFNVLESSLPTDPSDLTHPKGTYRWIAEYSGDANNGASSTACGDETHTITLVPKQ